MLGQRLGEWVGHSPALEEDLGLANLSLDLVGQARLLLTYAGELEGQGRDEDALAFLRDAPAVRESDAGRAAERRLRRRRSCGSVLLDAWQLEMYEALSTSTDTRLAGIAAKAMKETRYHFRFSSGWLVRLGDGTEESQRRVQDALNELWRFTDELFAADEVDEQMRGGGGRADLAGAAAALVGAHR